MGTLLSYAAKARRELPNTRVLIDGDVERLSKYNSFSAQHILTPLEGVAIDINAFNFPVGHAGKSRHPHRRLVPAIVKPASQTAYLTELVVRRIVESGILPEGAIQLIAGSVGDLLDHVTGQDVAHLHGLGLDRPGVLRPHPAIVENSVRFTMEADSLNASILGPDAGLARRSSTCS